MDINIVQSWDDIIDVTEDVTDIREWVLQKYIESPLLINGYKFHFRVYVLCVGALQVYVFDRLYTSLYIYIFQIFVIICLCMYI